MIRSLFAVVAALVGLAVLAGPVGADHHRDPAPVPTLTDVSATTRTPALFTVAGADFTAGGRVYLAIYDQMGATLYETRWVNATPSIAITGGGMLSTTFNGLCGADVLIRAYDQHTGFWTNWLESAPFCDAAPVGYGPH